MLSLISQPHARVEQTQDMLMNFLKGCKACKHAEFVNYKKKTSMKGNQVDCIQIMQMQQAMTKNDKYHEPRRTLMMEYIKS
jgi:hypothetical protein